MKFILILMVTYVNAPAITAVPTEYSSLEKCREAGAASTKSEYRLSFVCIPGGEK